MRLRPTWLLVSAPLLWACAAPSVDVGLSARMGAPRTGASGTPARLEQRLTLSNGIVVDRVRLVVRELELEREGDDSDDGVSNSAPGSTEAEDSEEFETGPFLLDLSGTALEGQMVQLSGLTVEAGSYDEIEFEIGTLSDDEVSGNAALTEMAAKNASVLVDGTIDGQPFSFVSDLWAEQEREVGFEVGTEGSPNVTINIDPRGWFTDSSGNRLDPRDSGNRSAIEANIEASLDAFDDEDQDGAEDVDDDADAGGA